MLKFLTFSLEDRYDTSTSSNMLFLRVILYFALIQSLLFLFRDYIILNYDVGILPNHSKIISSPFLLVILWIIRPFMEELLFRWGLTYSPSSTAMLILGLSSSVLKVVNVDESILPNKTVIILISSFTAWIVLWLLVNKFSNAIHMKYLKYYPLIFTVSIIVFSYDHLSNHDMLNYYRVMIYSPIILLPYFWFGYTFGLIRIKFGFWHAVLGHSVINFYLFVVHVHLLQSIIL